LKRVASSSGHETDANQKDVMNDHYKKLFIEQLFAMLRGGVKETPAVELTQDAAIEKARKQEPDAAIDVERGS
jgi:hypothetical protein